MNKKGFTLVEILVVIVLLGIIAVIVTPAVINGGDSAKKELLKHKIESIESSAVLYGQGNKDKFNKTCNGNNEPCKDISNCYCYDDDITVGYLIDENILNPDQDNEKDIINPLTKESLRDEKIVIYSKYGKIYAYLYNEDIISKPENNITNTTTTKISDKTTTKIATTNGKTTFGVYVTSKTNKAAINITVDISNSKGEIVGTIVSGPDPISITLNTNENYVITLNNEKSTYPFGYGDNCYDCDFKIDEQGVLTTSGSYISVNSELSEEYTYPVIEIELYDESVWSYDVFCDNDCVGNGNCTIEEIRKGITCEIPLYTETDYDTCLYTTVDFNLLSQYKDENDISRSALLAKDYLSDNKLKYDEEDYFYDHRITGWSTANGKLTIYGEGSTGNEKPSLIEYLENDKITKKIIDITNPLIHAIGYGTNNMYKGKGFDYNYINSGDFLALLEKDGITKSKYLTFDITDSAIKVKNAAFRLPTYHEINQIIERELDYQNHIMNSEDLILNPKNITVPDWLKSSKDKEYWLNGYLPLVYSYTEPEYVEDPYDGHIYEIPGKEYEIVTSFLTCMSDDLITCSSKVVSYSGYDSIDTKSYMESHYVRPVIEFNNDQINNSSLLEDIQYCN